MSMGGMFPAYRLEGVRIVSSLRKEEQALDERDNQALSPVLLAAQQKLDQLRQERRRQRVELGLPIYTDAHGRCTLPSPLSPSENKSECEIERPPLPSHLGWESTAVTAVLKSAQARQSAAQAAQAPFRFPILPQSAFAPASRHEQPAILSVARPDNPSVKLYPDVALAILKKEHAAPARIWLILQHLDNGRSGQIPIDTAREKLTLKESPWYICSWRQLRNLLAQGEDIFWQRSNGRIWLRSTVKVAVALNVQRLTGQPVALPVAILQKSIGTIRAHLYASFHSGRISESDERSASAKPISRATLEEMSHVSRRSQQNYEKRAGVERRYNFAVGEAVSTGKEQTRAWQQGQALFHFTDHKGRQGKAGTTYLAWQLPNQYFGPHSHYPKGRQKHINQKLAVLFMKGITGNGENLEDSGYNGRKRFYGNGISAIKAYNRASKSDVYWQDRQGNQRGYQVWHVLPGLEQT